MAIVPRAPAARPRTTAPSGESLGLRREVLIPGLLPGTEPRASSRCMDDRGRRRDGSTPPMSVAKPLLSVLMIVTAAAVSMGSGDGAAAGARSQTPSPGERPLPPPVQVRSEPEVALGDSAFEPLPGARADFGRLGGGRGPTEGPGHRERRAGPG